MESLPNNKAVCSYYNRASCVYSLFSLTTEKIQFEKLEGENVGLLRYDAESTHMTYQRLSLSVQH